MWLFHGGSLPRSASSSTSARPSVAYCTSRRCSAAPPSAVSAALAAAAAVSCRQAATSHSSVCEDNRDAAEPYRPRSALHSEQSQLDTWAENG